MTSSDDEIDNVRKEIDLSKKRSMLWAVFVVLHYIGKSVLFFQPTRATDFKNVC